MQKSQIYLDLKYDSGAKTYQWADNTDVSQYRHFDDKAKLDGSLKYVTVPTGNDFKMTWMTTNDQQENLIVCQKNPVTLDLHEAPTCPKGWTVLPSGKCYYNTRIIAESVNEAAQFCHSFDTNSTLLVIHNKAEWDELGNLFKNVPDLLNVYIALKWDGSQYKWDDSTGIEHYHHWNDTAKIDPDKWIYK
ncbi:unnamed protein product [Oppiella nova]|uniref:C-type lectin domain-containing protein n=1 Tax=Oppiella nova TaxID=334625 RepID=A0A7R9LPH7_9ACAR|nr:unnamed protein product [Oppiella nova]CAG2165697.1 unnamed protein product [Oppiella nova]